MKYTAKRLIGVNLSIAIFQLIRVIRILLLDYLKEEWVIAELQGADKGSVLKELSGVLVKPCQVASSDELLKVLLDREKLGSTGIGEGIAIPHGRLKKLKRFFISIIIVILLIFGFHEQRWLENQYPDTSNVVQFLQEKGFNGMQVAVDTDYGCSVYSYAMEKTFPLSDFFVY
jgi:hypothetical protein